MTDADLLLGYLDPAYFLGGEMALDIAAAEAAMARVADPLGLSAVEAAWGIHDIVNETMALASRTHIIERDEDPRRFALIAFGGAGPVHAQGVAAKLGVSRLIFPVAAGAASALGLLVARPSAEYVAILRRSARPLRLGAGGEAVLGDGSARKSRARRHH